MNPLFTPGGPQCNGLMIWPTHDNQVGGIRRVEVPGERPELSYPRDRSKRFTDDFVGPDFQIFKYR